jgi:hypothetical protein
VTVEEFDEPKNKEREFILEISSVEQLSRWAACVFESGEMCYDGA